MADTNLAVRVQNFGGGIANGLFWRDVTADCMRIETDQGLNGPRDFMPKAGTCVYVFENTDNLYTPVPNREDSSAYVLDIGRLIQHIVTLPTHGKALRVTYANPITLNAAYLSQVVTANTAAKDRWTLEFDARCHSDFLRNGIRAELRTNAPEVCEGQVFQITRKWRTYRLTFIAQSVGTNIEARFYNAFTADGTNVEFRKMSLTTSAGGGNKFSNPTFTSGTTGWTVSNAAEVVIDDYDIKFDGVIANIIPAPFAKAGKQTVTVVAQDWVSVLQLATAKFPLQKNKRADELIATVLANLPALYWVQAPPGRLLAQGHQTFDRSFTGYTERDTSLYDAIADAVMSENGMFWCDLDGTFRFESNTFPARRQLREGPPRPAWHIFQANPADGDLITLWGETYRFKNTLAAAYDVKIGTTAKDTALNLVNAINMDAATIGSSYHAATPIHSTATAALRDWRTTILLNTPTIFMRYGEAAGATAFDSSGNGNNGTYNGGVTLGATGAIPTDSDKGATFDGVNDTVSSPSISLYYTSFSVGMWIKPAAAPPATQDVFSAYSAFVTDQAFYIRLNSNGSITVDFYNDSYTTGTGKITFGTAYQYLMVTYDVVLDLTTIYVNGLQVGQANVGYFDSTTSPTITWGGFPAAGGNTYKGDMDEARLYLSCLSPAAVATEYASRYAGIALTKYLNTNETAELVLTEGNDDPYDMVTRRSAETVINKCVISWTPRQTTTAVIALAQIQGAVQIPPRSNSTNADKVKPGFSNVQDGRVGQQELTLTFRDASGNTIAGENVVDPVATTDYKIYEFADPTNHGYEYTISPYFWISDIKKNASQFTCILNNNALGALYATYFQVRGNAIYTYDRQEELSSNTTSINLYRERQRRREMPFTNDQLFCKSLSQYTVERYGYPFVEADYIETNAVELNGTYMLSLNLMDTPVITDTRAGLNGVRHMIVGISTVLVPNASKFIERIRFQLERLDQNQYFLLGNATYGALDSSSRIYI